MTHAHLTQLADQLLSGDITVEEASATVAVHSVVDNRNVKTSARLAPVVRDMGNHSELGDPSAACQCDEDRTCRALYLYREGVRPLFGVEEDRTLAEGLRAYNALPKDDRSQWLRGRGLEREAVRAYIELTQLVAFVEESCPADQHYIKCHTAVWNDLLRSPRTSQDEEKLVENRERWELDERNRLRWPLVSFEPSDEDHGYVPDPTNIKSSTALEREYAKPSTRIVEDFVRPFGPGWVEVDDEGSRRMTTVEVPTMGAVEWEYRRRKQMAAKNLTPLPFWMSPRHYKAVRDQERRLDKARRLRQRSQLIELIRGLGGDPRSPEVASWVRSNGITSCLLALEKRKEVAAC